MSLSEMHRRQRAKNWTLFSILLALCAIFFALTMIKLGGR